MRYDRATDVLRDLDLTIKAGSFHFLVGASGAGKTSLLRLLSLSHPAARGTVRLFGREVAGLDRAALAAIRRRIGVVFQDFRLLDHLSAFDNVALPLRIAGCDEAQIATVVPEMLRWLGLADLLEVRPGRLSMGQRQLVTIARAVVAGPALLLADEPLSHLDRDRRRRVMGLFLRLHRLGTTVILATHDRELVDRHPFDRIEIEAGRATVRSGEALAAAS